VRAEDSGSLDRFSIFLMRCKNTMECSKYLTKLEQPDTIKKLNIIIYKKVALFSPSCYEN